MASLTLYTNPMSRGCITRWMMEELGQPYEAVNLSYGPEMKSETYRALNPMGKVPTLVHGDAVVTEVAAICCYLADAFPEAGLAPAPGSPERGAYYRWMFFAAGPLEASVINRSFGFTLPETPEAAGRAGWGRDEILLDTLSAFVSGADPYLLGKTFSALDVVLGSQISWGLQFGTLPERDGFAEYVARIMERPAAKRANQIHEKERAEMN